MKSFLFSILLLTSGFLFAQSSYDVQLQGEIIKVEENIHSFQWDMMPASSKFENGYFGWIQFYETPKQAVQNDFKNRGLELIEYIPNKTYLFYFPQETALQYLKDNGVRAIVPVEGQYKLSKGLRESSFPEYALDGDNVLVMVKFHQQANETKVLEELARNQMSVVQNFKGSNVLELAIPINSIETLANLPFIKLIELITPPDDKYDDKARSLSRSNLLDTQNPNGRNYTGEGIGIMVRDFGSLGPHIDFQGRITEMNSDVASENHGDGVAGVFAGAGNLDVRFRGMAAGANIFNVDRSQTFLDAATLSLLNSGETQVTNTSSGFNCNNEYNLNAVTVDQQTKEIPNLLHVLAAGNTNGSDCGYGAGPDWSNLGGANKTGKNVIAAGNTNFEGEIVSNSSRGPAEDGRIKPDLCAMGVGQVSTDENNEYFAFGGTSAAAPAVAGIATQLYQAYSDLNGGALPSSALIKAVMLNSANDFGNIGPDYTYGWGIVNGLRAAKIIEQEQYFSEEISQGVTNNHTINVPSGATQVRFMVYWTDVPGAVGANPALVNDLDLVVNTPGNSQLFPWILDPTPNPIALNTPATIGPDHLNNMEQVEINNPAAGDYILDISGFNVPMGPQEYFIVYEITTENINLTHPNGGESFVPGEDEVIHWDAINTTEDFVLEISLDNGVSWTTIAIVPSDENTYVWDVPAGVNGAALFRVSSGSFTDIGDANFSIVNQVEGFVVSQKCPELTTYNWNLVPGAESYDIYKLGERFMEFIGSSTTNIATLETGDPTEETWVAIVAKNDTENWSSRRTVAINSPGGLLSCPLNNDVSIFEILNDPEDLSTPCSDTEAIVVSAVIRNSGTDAQSNFEVSYQLDNNDVVTEIYTGTLMPGQVANFDFSTTLEILQAGEYNLAVFTNLGNDENEFNDEVVLNFFAAFNGAQLDFEENFEVNGVTPAGWNLINPDDNITWVVTNGVIGIDGNTSKSLFLNNWGYNAMGQEDFLVTEFFDLTDVSSASVLNFDLAKAQWNEFLNDGLRVEISVDCGQTYSTIYEKNNLELSTIPGYNNTDGWQPLSGNDWRTEEISLAAYVGQSVQFRFVNINGWANSTYIDNIRLREDVVNVDETILSKVKIFPNPASETLNISLGDLVSTDALAVITNSLGQVVSSTPLNDNYNTTIDVSNYTSGLYFVTINIKGVSETKKIVIE